MTAAGGPYGLARRIQTDNPIKKSTLRVLFFIYLGRGMAKGPN